MCSPAAAPGSASARATRRTRRARSARPAHPHRWQGEKRTLRLVAEHADACNLFDIPDGGATVRHKLRVLAGHCAAVGRPHEEIDKTISVRFDPAQPVEAFAEHCSELAELGIEHVVTLTTGAWTPAAVEAYAAAAKMLATR